MERARPHYLGKMREAKQVGLVNAGLLHTVEGKQGRAGGVDPRKVRCSEIKVAVTLGKGSRYGVRRG